MVRKITDNGAPPRRRRKHDAEQRYKKLSIFIRIYICVCYSDIISSTTVYWNSLYVYIRLSSPQKEAIYHPSGAAPLLFSIQTRPLSMRSARTAQNYFCCCCQQDERDIMSRQASGWRRRRRRRGRSKTIFLQHSQMYA